MEAAVSGWQLYLSTSQRSGGTLLMTRPNFRHCEGHRPDVLKGSM